MPGRKKRKSTGRRRRPNRKKERIRFLCCFYLTCAVALAGGIYLALYRYVHQVEENVICGHVFIGQVDVSGMTMEQAEQALGAELAKYGTSRLTMQVGGQEAEATLGEMGLAVREPEQLARQAVDYGKKGMLLHRWKQMRRLKKKPYRIRPVFDLKDDMAATVIRERAVPLEKRAVDAAISRESGAFVITDEAEGHNVDVDQAVKAIEARLNGEWDGADVSVKLPEAVEEPRIRRADLESISDELGSYSTDAGYGSRVTNLQRGAELLNGRILLPGEELSVLESTMPYTEENGYVDGGAYENGEVVQSIAGGICQVSTTLYNAVLYAELEVTQRYAHSIIVSYVDPSRDAAVAEGVKDFKFKNNYGTPVYIEGYIDGDGQLQFHIYGKETRPEGREVEYESETLERLEYTTTYVEDPEQAIGSMDTKGTPINGRTARLWKVVFQDGQEVSRDIINESEYQPTNIKIYVGTASESSEASAMVRSAISSQDEEKIQSAIGSAQAAEKKAAEGTGDETQEQETEKE